MKKAKGLAIDKRTTRHEVYQVSQKIHKRIEEIFGWLKTAGGLKKLPNRGLKKVDWMVTLVTTTAYNSTVTRNLIEDY